MGDERETAIYRICEREDRFRPMAYFLVFAAVTRAQEEHERPTHITGRELLSAFGEEVRRRYGPMSLTVLRHLGLGSARDVGELVFLMVREGLLSKTDEDRLEDFDEGYDFEKEFVRGYAW